MLKLNWIPDRVKAWFAAAVMAGLVFGFVAINKRLAPAVTHACDDPSHDHGQLEVGKDNSDIFGAASVFFLLGGLLVWAIERIRVFRIQRGAT